MAYWTAGSILSFTQLEVLLLIVAPHSFRSSNKVVREGRNQLLRVWRKETVDTYIPSYLDLELSSEIAT